VDDFEQVFVSHHQMLVLAGDDFGELHLYTVGDDLVHLVGESALTVMTGPHTGQVAVRAEILPGPPDAPVRGWDAVSEATLWCPDGRLTVGGLMGDFPDVLRDLAIGGPGLVRVQVRARNRLLEDVTPEEPRPGPREEYEVLAWPVQEDVGMRTVCPDEPLGPAWTPDPGRAAGWAMVRLVAGADPDPYRASLRAPVAERAVCGRVDVLRAREVAVSETGLTAARLANLLGATVDGQALSLSVGDLTLELRLPQEPAVRPLTGEWRWVAAPESFFRVPHAETTTVQLDVRGPGALTVAHRGVHEEDAVLLGLVWEYLLYRAELVAGGGDAPPHPWQAVLEDIATKETERAVAERASRELREAREWGGWPPSERLRRLPANTWSMAQLDRRLLDAVADATPDLQRDIARWAAKRGCAVAGLAAVDWIAAGLAALDSGAPLPPPFDGQGLAWDRLFADPRVPLTTVTLPSGTPNFSQQAAAFPAIFAATNDDPLAAAVDALHHTAGAYGHAYEELFTAARSAFPVLDRES